jgi:hypothetical protein
MSRSSVLSYKGQGPEKSLCLDLSTCSVPCRDSRYLSHLVDSDDAVVGGQRLNKANRSAVVVLGSDHGFNLRVEILLG